MNDYVIVTDSCTDLPNELVEKMELKIVPLSVNVDGKNYVNYLDEREITFKDFYSLLRNKAHTQTSQAAPVDFINVLDPILASKKDVLAISFSSALSGTFNSLAVAKNEMSEKYPDRKIIIIDSLSASLGMGLLVTYAYRLKNQNKSIEEVAMWVEENKTKLCHLFTVDDLNHLRRGGRLSPISAILGTILRVKPLLHVSMKGKLTVVSKSRGRHTALDMLVEQMINTIEKPEGQTIYISHGDCLEEAEYVRDRIKEKLPITDFVINYVGPVIGSHSGPGTIALFYLGNDRYHENE